MFERDREQAVCVCEFLFEKERVCVCMFVFKKERDSRVYVCDRVCDRERE